MLAFVLFKRVIVQGCISINTLEVVMRFQNITQLFRASVVEMVVVLALQINFFRPHKSSNESHTKAALLGYFCKFLILRRSPAQNPITVHAGNDYSKTVATVLDTCSRPLQITQSRGFETGSGSQLQPKCSWHSSKHL